MILINSDTCSDMISVGIGGKSAEVPLSEAGAENLPGGSSCEPRDEKCQTWRGQT